VLIIPTNTSMDSLLWITRQDHKDSIGAHDAGAGLPRTPAARPAEPAGDAVRVRPDR
jgi:hypothetical protein